MTQPGSSKRIDALVNIGDNIALGTEVTVTRYVRTATGVDEDSFTFTVDRFRVVGLTGISDSEFFLPTNGQAEFTFNLTSMSTESLEVDVLLGEVDGLEYDCSHQEENQRLRVFLLESPVATITIPITCEVTATPEFENGIVTKELNIIGNSNTINNKLFTGTKITFLPTNKIFKDVNFNFKSIEKRLRELAFLNTGISIYLTDKRQSEEKNIHFKYDGGIKEYVKYLNEGKNLINSEPIFFYSEKKKYFY